MSAAGQSREEATYGKIEIANVAPRSGFSKDNKLEVQVPGQVLLTNKDADIILENSESEGWSLWFVDCPDRGHCLSIEFIPCNSPSVTVQVQDTKDAMKNVADVIRDDPSWERVERLG